LNRSIRSCRVPYARARLQVIAGGVGCHGRRRGGGPGGVARRRLSGRPGAPS
jgi:hypothetical protein